MAQRRWQDTPLGVWVIENSLPSLVAFLNLRTTHSATKPTFLKNWLMTFLGGFVTVDGTMLIQHLLVKYLYKHVEFIVPRDKLVPQRGLEEMRLDYFRTMIPTQFLTAGLAAAAMNLMPASQWAYVSSRPFRLLPFLFRFALIRLLIDVSFYAVHRALHLPLFYPIHKRHHEHVNTLLPTNYHFTPTDLALEGFVPVFFGTLVVDVLHGLTRSPWFLLLPSDVALIYAYAMWYEIASHCGKPMPLSMFPPLAPVYNALYKKLAGSREGLDDHNVLFHERHHNLLACNYGITPWLDWLFGTARLQAKKKSSDAEPAN